MLTISSVITTMFSLKIPNTQVNTLDALLNTNMYLSVPSSFFYVHAINDPVILNRFRAKVEQGHIYRNAGELFKDTRWIIEASLGKSALFLTQLTLKQAIH